MFKQETVDDNPAGVRWVKFNDIIGLNSQVKISCRSTERRFEFKWCTIFRLAKLAFFRYSEGNFTLIRVIDKQMKIY